MTATDVTASIPDKMRDAVIQLFLHSLFIRVGPVALAPRTASTRPTATAMLRRTLIRLAVFLTRSYRLIQSHKPSNTGMVPR